MKKEDELVKDLEQQLAELHKGRQKIKLLKKVDKFLGKVLFCGVTALVGLVIWWLIKLEMGIA